MTHKKVSLFIAILVGFVWATSSFAQTKKPMHTFIKKDGTPISAAIQKYSTSSSMVRVRAEDGEVVELPFDQITPENQEIITEWKMDAILQSSNFEVSYKRNREASEETFKEGTDIKKEEEAILYTLTLTNKERIPITGLTIVYAVAYEKKSVLGRGVASTEGDGLGFYVEKLPVMDIPAKETITIQTPTFTLKSYEDTYGGGTASRGRDRADAGGKIKEEFKGVVFRIIRNDELIREEASPKSLAKRDFTILPENAPAQRLEKK